MSSSGFKSKFECVDSLHANAVQIDFPAQDWGARRELSGHNRGGHVTRLNLFPGICSLIHLNHNLICEHWWGYKINFLGSMQGIE